MDDEPLSEWARRRAAKVGRLRAVPLLPPGDGPQGSHLHPDAPRVIQRWNGYAWELHGFAANLAEAKRLLHPGAGQPPAPPPAPERQPLAPGTGKHRNPQPPGPHRR